MSEENINVENVEEEVEFKTEVTIADTVFEITPLNAKKTTFIANMFGRLLISGKLKMKQFKGLDGKDLPFAILAALDEDMLVELAATIIGSDKEFAQENFDLVWVTEALLIQATVSDLDKVLRNFTSLVSQIV